MILGVDRAAHIPTKWHYAVRAEKDPRPYSLNPTGIKCSKTIKFQTIDLIKILNHTWLVHLQPLTQLLILCYKPTLGPASLQHIFFIIRNIRSKCDHQNLKASILIRVYKSGSLVVQVQLPLCLRLEVIVHIRSTQYQKCFLKSTYISYNLCFRIFKCLQYMHGKATFISIRNRNKVTQAKWLW